MSVTDPHEFGSDGLCRLCGFALADMTCPHEHTSGYAAYRKDGDPISFDANGHTIPVIPYTYVTCEDCGAVMTTVGERTVETLPHSFLSDGTCADCGYVNTCEHEHTTATTTFRNARHFTDAGNGTHSFVADTWEVVVCDDCGMEFSSLIEADAACTGEHHYNWQGICFDCGAILLAPTTAPTAAPTATPTTEPTVAPTTEPTAAPTVELTVAPTTEPGKQEIVGALTEALSAVEEEGEDVKVEIVGVQEVLTQSEYSVLTTLSAQEQVLVVLQSIGLSDVASAAVAAMNVTLSDDAQTLMDQVSERIRVLTGEEKAAYEERLAEYFPMTERVDLKSVGAESENGAEAGTTAP